MLSAGIAATSSEYSDVHMLAIPGSYGVPDYSADTIYGTAATAYMLSIARMCLAHWEGRFIRVFY